MRGAAVEYGQQRANTGRGSRVAGVMAVALLAVVPRSSLSPQTPAVTAAQSLPFAIGERLNYSVHAGVAGTVGHGSMWIEGPVVLRGSQTYVLHSDFKASLGFFHPFARSESWLDPETFATMRFEKAERHLFTTDTEKIDVALDLQRLDELSFIYYIRTLALAPDSAYSMAKHYDAARNPVHVRVVGRDTITTAAGKFATVAVEMRVKDPRHFDREGVIRLYLTDDRVHLPVRIESRASVFGTAVFLLDSWTKGGATHAEVAPASDIRR